MKKFIVSIIAVLYLFASTGAAVNVHYCMGKMADWSLGHKNSKACGYCGMKNSVKKNNGCCTDEHKFIKNEDDQKAGSSFQLNLKQIAAELPLSYFSYDTEFTGSITEDHPISNSPPRSGNVPLYLFKRTFLI